MKPGIKAGLQGAAAGAVLGLLAQAATLGAGIVLCAVIVGVFMYGTEMHHQGQRTRIRELEAKLRAHE